MKEAGPVRMLTSPILISVSLMPGSAASAPAPDSKRAPKPNASIRLIVFLPVIVFSVRERPVGPVLADVTPQADQSVRLEAQERDDHHAIGDAANFEDI